MLLRRFAETNILNRCVPLIASVAMMLSWFPAPTWADPVLGDANGDGIVDMDDPRCIARFLVNQIPSIPNPAGADATQNGTVDMEDAFAIAAMLTGQSCILVVAPRYGFPNSLRVGDVVRVEAFEKFFPFNIKQGAVRIQSASTGYDSGTQAMTFEQSGRSIYYQWHTSGLQAAADYEVQVTLKDDGGATVSTASTTVALDRRYFEPRTLTTATDAYCPGPGIPLVFRRIVPHDSGRYPYLGPLGYGWVHNYDIFLEESTDGTIAFRGASGANRIFRSNKDGTYTASPGDYGILTRDPDGTFQLKEKNGLTYRFRNDLRLDAVQDRNENKITAGYDTQDRLVTVSHSNGKSFTITYDGDRIRTLTDHAARTTTYMYSADHMELIQVADPLTNITEYWYITNNAENLRHRLGAVGYPDDTHVHWEYDSDARLSRKTGTWGGIPVTYSYAPTGITYIADAVGATSVVQVTDLGLPSILTDPDGGQTQVKYNSAGEPVTITDPLLQVIRVAYDIHGNVVSISNHLGEATTVDYDLRFHTPSAATDALTNITSVTYDDDGNPVQTIYADGTSSSNAFDADGNLVAYTDPMSNTTYLSYNNCGRVVSIQDALNQTTRLAYANSGELSAITNARGYGIAYERDLLGRLTKRTYADGSHEDYARDAAGNVTSLLTRAGETMAFEHDNLGRVEWKHLPSGKSRRFLYDARGMLSSVETHQGTNVTLDVNYEHDLSRRLTLVRVPRKTHPDTYDVSYAYDAAGNRTALVYPDGYRINYEYDAANRLTRIADTNDNTIVAYEYNASGYRTRRTLGNGTYTVYQYDSVYNVTNLTNYGPTNNVLSFFAYTYDDAGICISMVTLEGTNTYHYDDTYQLTVVEYPNGTSVGYEFDEAGNRVTVTSNGIPTAYTVNELDQYTTVGDQTLHYDANGNLTNRATTTETVLYGWDSEGRLISVDRNGVHIDYEYDYAGRLVSKTVDGLEHRFVWDRLEIIAEMDSEGCITRRYVYGPTMNEIVRVVAGGTNTWLMQNAIGSIVGTTDDSGIATSTCRYDIYGTLRTGTAHGLPHRLAGMWWDRHGKLYYVRARWYDPAWGRFLSPDPIGVKGGINVYRYARNAPLDWIDPGGCDIVDVSAPAPISYFSTEKGRQELADGFLDAIDKVHRNETSLFGPKVDDSIYEDKGDSYAVDDPSGSLDELGQNGVDTSALAPGSQLGDLLNSMPPIPPIPPIPQIPPDWPPDIPWDGGICPTFVQPSATHGPDLNSSQPEGVKDAALTARIIGPPEDSLLRSDIPVFGTAAGADFARYSVEVGQGSEPRTWKVIDGSDQPETAAGITPEHIAMMQGDLDLRGNLATWNCGLKNWVHLPWHPPEDPTDCNGVYTIRLVVEGKDGTTVEDRVTCDVGRVIAQCLPGIAISPDRRVVMRFPEQALTKPFRVFTILTLDEVGEKTPPHPKGTKFIGPVYRIREPGERFIKDVSLEFQPTAEERANTPAESIGICRYDVTRKQWVWLPTTYADGSRTFTTVLTELPKAKAIYALARDTTTRCSRAAVRKQARPKAIPCSRPGMFVHCDFEKDMGTFAARDRWVGAALSRNNRVTPDNSYCLKLANENHGGNFSCTVLDRPFDVRKYPVMGFDYRIGPNVRIDFLLKVNGRWCNLRFTDDPVDYRNQDVNIVNLGAIEGVVADGKWHTVNVDLGHVLRRVTAHTVVEEIILADWDVGGYMKLAFGGNARGAAFYLDNFRITGSGKRGPTPEMLLVDNFGGSNGANRLGLPAGAYCTPGSRHCVARTVPVKNGDAETDSSLEVVYDMRRPGAYGGYWTSLKGRSVADYSVLRFRMRADSPDSTVTVGIRDLAGVEASVPLACYVAAPRDNGWRDVAVPTCAFNGGCDIAAPDVLFLSVSHEAGADKNTLWLDDIRFDKSTYRTVADFEAGPDLNLLGGRYRTLQNGAAAVSACVMPEPVEWAKATNHVVRISYGGTIGKDYGVNGGFSYGLWECGLQGIDARRFSHLAFRMRGETGGETPNFYLSDGHRRICLRATKVGKATTEWQDQRLPLSFFADRGVDISHLHSLQVVFEWKEQSGTVYLDDVQFISDKENSSTPRSVALSEQRRPSGGETTK